MNLLTQQIKSIIDKVPLQIAREMVLWEAIALMAKNSDQSRYAVVLKEGRLAGILTERDVVQAIVEGIDLVTATVNDVLKSPAIAIPLSQAENLINNPPQLLQFFQKHHFA